MLTAIRTNFSRGLSRVVLVLLMLLLIASFALWGIQDVFRNFSNREVVNIGGRSISSDTYQQLYRQRLQVYSQRFGQVITPAMAKLIGLDKQILDGLVSENAQDIRAKAYSLGLDPLKVAAAIQQDPAFQQGGRFDQQKLQLFLRNNGLSEAGLVASQGDNYLRRQLSEAFTGGTDAPKVLQEAMNRFGEETRNIAYIPLNDAVLGTIAPPDADALQKFYDEHKSQFRAPEYRKFSYVVAAPKEMAKKVTVTDDDARATYESTKAKRYTTPEKRTLEQITFPNAADAKAASDRIAAGSATFEAIATERGIKPADLTLGDLAKPQINDPAVADAAFGAQEGKVSAPITTKLATVLVRVTKIQPEAVTPFDTVKEAIRQEMTLQRANKELSELHKVVEDERIGGSPLKEIAPKLGLPLVTVAEVDAKGLDSKGQKVELPQQAKLAPGVFAADAGGEIETLDARGEGTVWYAVDAITPERERTLDEAKADVTAAWTTAEKARLLQARATDTVKALEGGKSLDEVAKASNLEVKQAWGIKRQGESQGLAPSAVALAFATPQKGFASALSGNGTERIVFQVLDKIVPTFDPATPQALNLGKQYGQSIAQDLYSAYVEEVKTEVGVTINQGNLDRVVGPSEN